MNREALVISSKVVFLSLAELMCLWLYGSLMKLVTQVSESPSLFLGFLVPWNVYVVTG
uniref:Uncharacterized protein n=1 Tax=Picea sitchensis TaxID=3332 RepID=A0A6B9XXP5_PICSI|nr:hypothetical protein Q903MT_gene6867 [Picea sitchensis]